MSPQITETRIPDRMILIRRQTCQPSAVDERPQLRTAEGRTLAVVETWQPN